MKQTNKVIKFPEQEPFFEFLEELKQAYKEERLNNFICIYDCDYEKGKEIEGFTGENKKFWFGEKSCIYLLGMLRVMGATIEEYIREANDSSY